MALVLNSSTKWKQDEDEVSTDIINITKDIEEGEPDWKAVGSPSRRESFSIHGNNNNSPPQLPASQEYRRSSVSSDKPWGSFGGIQWEGPSMFDEKTATPELYDPTSILSVPMLPNISLEPTYKPQRSFSFSTGQEPNFFGYDDYNTRSALAPTMEEDEELDSFDDAYLRARSQSSNATLGMNPSLYWNNNNGRRSSLGFVSFSPDKNPQQRRMSQPEFSFPDIIPKGNNGSYLMANQFTERLKNFPITKSASTSASSSITAKQQQQPIILPDTSVSTPSQDGVSVGKGMLLLRLPPHIPLFMVEFKSGRTDYYYVSDPLIRLRIGDLVIVEADRGKDLGKVATDVLTVDQVVLLQKQSHSKLMDENEKTTETHVKRIYRQASHEEANMLLVKDQDEQRALSVCLQKIKIRKLPMEVVDAEFQWDRRKLTFYFIAEKRIDFRELVRELFKIYKTRIWM
ncbi:hypothetical protein INT47_004518 [Mucor saturninus]|uniref:PSP1 C-terminal domain-containing protein n=1 Tax=Mucor saturninus TaxID=64648 RepID=A0A8H7RIV3_9FUNG|nr:hypothetical protein INT47_004518 [Mucor saturninus]